MARFYQKMKKVNFAKIWMAMSCFFLCDVFDLVLLSPSWVRHNRNCQARATNNRGRVVAAWFGAFKEVARSHMTAAK